MTCEEYVVEKLMSLENRIDSQKEQTNKYRDLALSYKAQLDEIKSMMTFRQHDSYQKIELSAYSTYDAKDFAKLVEIFNPTFEN